MSDFRDNIIGHRQLGRYYSIGGYRLRPHAGSYNGTTCNAGTVVDIDDRWRCIELTDGVNDAVLKMMRVPDYYKTGTDINVIVGWSTQSTTTGNAYYDVGLAASGAGDVLTTEASVTYTGLATYAGPTVTNELILNTFTFSGAGIQAGDNLSAIIYRVGGNASDTINAAMEVVSASFDFNINAKGNLTI